MKLVRALFYSIKASFQKEGLVCATDKAWFGFLVLSAYVLHLTPRATTLEADRRLSQCKLCKFYDPELSTCGNMRNPQTFTNEYGNHELYGCGCYLPIKVKLREATCWSAEVGIEDKWTS